MQRAAQGLVGQHHIETERDQRPKQFVEAARSNDDVELVPTQQRAYEIELEVARQGGDRADPHLLARLPAIPERRDEIVAAGEDGVGMFERDLSRLGQDQLAPGAIKQAMTKPLLELGDLHRQR